MPILRCDTPHGPSPALQYVTAPEDSAEDCARSMQLLDALRARQKSANSPQWFRRVTTTKNTKNFWSTGLFHNCSTGFSIETAPGNNKRIALKTGLKPTEALADLERFGLMPLYKQGIIEMCPSPSGTFMFTAGASQALLYGASIQFNFNEQEPSIKAFYTAGRNGPDQTKVYIPLEELKRPRPAALVIMDRVLKTIQRLAEAVWELLTCCRGEKVHPEASPQENKPAEQFQATGQNAKQPADLSPIGSVEVASTELQQGAKANKQGQERT